MSISLVFKSYFSVTNYGACKKFVYEIQFIDYKFCQLLQHTMLSYRIEALCHPMNMCLFIILYLLQSFVKLKFYY